MNSKTPWLIVGLGNPGPKYNHTPHNAGFMAADLIKKNLKLSDWKDQKKNLALVSVSAEQNFVLAKPQTFMNESGKAVKNLLRLNYKKDYQLIVIYDDLALPLGSVRIGINKSSGGHNGVESILEHLGHNAFYRVRIGIAPTAGQSEPAEIFVLRKLKPTEKIILEKSVGLAAAAAIALLTQPLEKVQNEFNK